MIKILITTSTFSKQNLDLLNEKKKYKFLINESGQKVKETFLIKNIKDVDAVIAGTEIYNERILASAKKLKLISRIGVGIDNIDLKYCKKNKIKVLSSKTELSTGVAEHSLALIFSALKKINYFDKNLKKNIWKKKNTNLLYGKKIGIIGFGKIGKKIYNLTKPFNLEYFYNDKIKIKNSNIRYKTIKEIFSICDIITLHLPFNKNTKNIIEKKILSNVSHKIIIINTSRGEIINENDLFRFLIKNKESVTCLDVFGKEPYKGNLNKLSNIILTPHVSGYSFEIRNSMEKEALKNIIDEFKKR